MTWLTASQSFWSGSVLSSRMVSLGCSVPCCSLSQFFHSRPLAGVIAVPSEPHSSKMAGQAVKANVTCGRADVTSMAKEAPRQGQHSMSDDAATDYRPVRRDEAFGAIEELLRGLQGLDGAFFSTPGLTSSEAAFDYHFLVLDLRVNRPTDCFKMCHESSGDDLTAVLGVGRGLASLEDLHHQELILIAGRASGRDQPSMLTPREKAKQDGAITGIINPASEVGWLECCNPRAVRRPAGRANHLADDSLPIRNMPGMPGGTRVDMVPAQQHRGTPRRELQHSGLPDVGGLCHRLLAENKRFGAAGFCGDVSGTPTAESVPVRLEAVRWACSAGLDCGQKQIVYGATASGIRPVP